MHEVLGVGGASSRDQAVPVHHQVMAAVMAPLYADMSEVVEPDALQQQHDLARGIATTIPICNRRLALPDYGEQSRPGPLAVVPALPPTRDYG